MSSLFEGMARRALFTLDPETAHGLSIKALKSGMVPGCRADRDPRLATAVAGLNFPNPLGMAAGYDKNAEVASELAHLGFGFVEVGTLTPRAQTGNSKPRIFRLVRDQAVINRLGFNNKGHAAAHARISGGRREGILGVNIGANKDSEDRAGRLRGRHFAVCRCGGLLHRQHLLAQHPGPAQSADPRGTFGPPEPGACRAGRKAKAHSGVSQDRTGPHRA